MVALWKSRPSQSGKGVGSGKRSKRGWLYFGSEAQRVLLPWCAEQPGGKRKSRKTADIQGSTLKHGSSRATASTLGPSQLWMPDEDSNLD